MHCTCYRTVLPKEKEKEKKSTKTKAVLLSARLIKKVNKMSVMSNVQKGWINPNKN